jgi:hypothetical protein
MSGGPEPLIEGLETYRSQSIPEGYTNTVELDEMLFISAVLGVNAMAIEPYSGLSKPLEGMEVEEWYRYLFVYYLHPLDRALLNTVIEVKSHRDGKCLKGVICVINKLKGIYKEFGIWVAAVSADGDTGYSAFVNPSKNSIYKIIEEGNFQTVVESLTGKDSCFLPDMLHMLKCMRNRLATDVIAWGTNTTYNTTCADTLDRILKLGPALMSNKGSAQLKDSLAMKVFTLRNMFMILKQGLDEPDYIAEAALAAMLFAPDVLWRLANQARNITRTYRVLLLKFASGIVQTLAE